MLRESGEATDTPLDLRGIVDDRVDPLVPAGRQLRAFADACTRRDRSARDITRGALTDTLVTLPPRRPPASWRTSR